MAKDIILSNDIELEKEKGEIMRISIRTPNSNFNSDQCTVLFACDGNTDIMLEGLVELCNKQFKLICITEEQAALALETGILLSDLLFPRQESNSLK